MTNENTLFTAIAKALLRQAGYVPFLWHVTDVRCLIEDRGLNVTLTNGECLGILENADRNHDANIGMNWDALEAELTTYLETRDEAPSPGVAELLRAARHALQALEGISEALHYEDGHPVTFLGGRDIQLVYDDATAWKDELAQAIAQMEGSL